jgi:hypothetical protein
MASTLGWDVKGWGFTAGGLGAAGLMMTGAGAGASNFDLDDGFARVASQRWAGRLAWGSRSPGRRACKG